MKGSDLVIAALAAACLAALPASAVAFTWQLPAARYQGLNQFERRQYDKAAALVEKQDYKTAAGEFEKFQAEFPDSSMLSYTLFMRGYCLDKSNNRNTAIKVYQEVIDYFPEKVEDYAAALYHVGVAHLDNGDTLKGVKALQTLADDPRYKDHPLTAGAIRRLGDYYWSRRQYEAAVKCWKQVVADYSGKNDEEVNLAANSAISWYIKNRDYAGYEAWMLERPESTRRRRPQERRRRLRRRLERVHDRLGKIRRRLGEGKNRKGETQGRGHEGLLPILAIAIARGSIRPATPGDYHELALQFLTSLWRRPGVAAKPPPTSALALIKQIKDKTDADNKLARLVDFLNQQEQYERAAISAGDDAGQDPRPLQGLRVAGPREQVGQGGGAAGRSGATRQRAMEAAGPVGAAPGYTRITPGQYEKAIKLYEQIDKPPGDAVGNPGVLPPLGTS